MKKLITRLLYALVLVAVFLTAAGRASWAATAITIWSPRSATPAFAEPGGSITAEVLAPDSLPSTGWQAWLVTDLGKRWQCAVTAAVPGSHNLDLGAKSGWQITLRVPADAAPELCDLEIRCPNAGQERRESAVSVVPRLESSFYLVVLTDEHIWSEHVEKYRNDLQKQSGFHSADLIRLTAKVANIANPRFVLKPGDFSTTQAITRKQAIQRFYLPSLRDFRVPTLISSGNHEHDLWADVPRTRLGDYGIPNWEHDFGARSFVTRIGSFYVLSHETGCSQTTPHFDQALLERVQARYRADINDPGVKFRLITQHGQDPRLGSLFPEHLGLPCDLMLSGHDHKTMIKSATPYYRLAITTAQDWGRSVWFRFRRNADGTWTCPEANPNYSDANNTVNLVNDARIGEMKLREQYTYPNDGTCRRGSNSCTITNEIPFSFEDGRVRFLMPRGRYTINGGEKLGQYDYFDGKVTRTAVICRVNIPARGERSGSATVAVRRVGWRWN